MTGRFWSVAIVTLLLMGIALTGCCGLGCGALSRWRLPGVRTEVLSGSGNLVRREMDWTSFDRLEVSQTFQVTLRQSSAYRVMVTVDDNLVDKIEVRRVGNTLRIGLKEGSWSLSNVTLQAEVSMPRLTALELSGASSLKGVMDTDDVRFTLSGASKLTLEGTGGDMDLRVSGASDVALSGFAVQNAKVEVSGASQATVHVRGRWDVQASGASQLRYLGSPEIGRVETSGAASVAPAR